MAKGLHLGNWNQMTTTTYKLRRLLNSIISLFFYNSFSFQLVLAAKVNRNSNSYNNNNNTIVSDFVSQTKQYSDKQVYYPG